MQFLHTLSFLPSKSERFRKIFFFLNANILFVCNPWNYYSIFQQQLFSNLMIPYHWIMNCSTVWWHLKWQVNSHFFLIILYCNERLLKRFTYFRFLQESIKAKWSTVYLNPIYLLSIKFVNTMPSAQSADKRQENLKLAGKF